MTPHPRLIAIGGGGFTHETDPEMENFMLAQLPTARPRIGFVGTASRDDPAKIARFHARFAAVCASHTHLPMAANAAQAHAWLDDLDIVYVGGGNTLHLVAHWSEQGIDQVMKAAARRGVLMAGVSAGANVWFDHALSDSGAWACSRAGASACLPAVAARTTRANPNARPYSWPVLPAPRFPMASPSTTVWPCSSMGKA